MQSKTDPGSSISRACALTLLAGTAACLHTSLAHANPVIDQVTAGTVTINEAGSNMTIEASDQSIIDWYTFDVGFGESVEFIQPDAQSVVLNRVTGGLGPSQIDGTVTGNGTLLFVNPAGWIFSATSVLDAGGFLAAAADLSNDFFDLDESTLTGIAGAITIEGMITANDVKLIASSIINHGQIIADEGLVTLYSDSGPLVGETGSRVFVNVGSRTTEDGVNPYNYNRTRAPLGAGDAYSLGITNTGSIEAHGGNVNIIANNGDFVNEGSIDISSEYGPVGNINVLAHTITNHGEVRADSGDERAGNITFSSLSDIILECDSLLSAAGAEGDYEGYPYGDDYDYGGGGRGGRVTLLARGDIEMYSHAEIDVSGGEAGGLVVMNTGGNIDAAGTILLDGSMMGRLLEFEGTPGVDDNATSNHCAPPPPPPPPSSDLLAGSYPDEIPFTDSVKPDSYDMTAIQRLSILGQAPSSSQILASQRGNSRFNDMPSDRASDSQARTTSAYRLNARAIEEAREAYDAVFGEPDSGRNEQIAQMLGSAFDEYTSSMTLEQITDVNPVAFRFWIDRNPAQEQTALVLTQVGTLLDKLRGMGLSGQEYLETEQRILQSISPSGGLHTDVLIETINASTQVSSL
ncbi:MAG: filamentous hemagglutinin N-terminal domain-containing protein [Phycisphaerales bacterium JB043]